ncbi:Uncharacterised protein [Achromobacter xylosoxidans]|nr:Uncharacterised protein [Achromobacter xylosoxidans]
MRGLEPTTQLPWTILPLGAASPGWTELGCWPLALRSVSWSGLPEAAPVSVTCRNLLRSALASTGCVKVTASASESLYWRGWQLSTAKASAVPTVAVAGRASGLAAPPVAAGAAVVAAGVAVCGVAGADGWPPLPIHHPTPMAPATTIAPATASQVLLFFPLTANLPAYSNAMLLCGGAADLIMPRASRCAVPAFATLYSRTPPVVAALFLRVQTGSITHCKGCWRARAYCATWAIRVAARSRG